MKSSTYASMVTIICIKHRNAISRSIEGVIRTTDQLCQKLGYQVTLSHMTKYRIVNDLIASNILMTKKTKKNIKVGLSARVQNLLE